jgi:PGF-CTERM protein
MSPPRRALTLACLFALASLAVPVVAVDQPRDAPEDTDPPVVVYVGEEDLNVSTVELTGGGTVGMDETQFVGVAGDADGEVLTVDPTAADFRFATPGAYDSEADADERPELTVTDPDVTDLVLRNERGVNVTGDTVDDLDSLTVEAEYDFAEADRLDVTVETPGGLDLTPNGRITESPGSLTVDVRNEGTGTFQVTVEGSELEDASRTATVTVGRDDGTTRTRTDTRTTTTTRTATASPTPTATPTSTPTGTASPTVTPTPTPTGTASPTVTPTPTLTTDDGDGFGATVAVTALAAAVALARRRR